MADHEDEPRDVQARRVLVVDDNRDAADTSTAILRLLGHEVECAYNGASALQLAAHFRPGVVMLDLAMPEMNGIETLSRLRRTLYGANVFAIAMTGYGSHEDKRRTAEAGFDAHPTKPVGLDALITLLNQARERAGVKGARA
jgi:CheY-like chemotaxis protein